MGIFKAAITGARMSHDFIGAPSFAQVNPYNMFKQYYSDDYASAYPNIRAISNEYMKIRPYAIDKNGKPVKHPALDALYHPNKADSSVMFAEKVAVSTLALPLTYILVWRNEGNEAKPGGPFTAKGQNIAGYTFLESPAISIVDKKVVYTIGSQVFTEDEVMVLPGGVTPNDLYAGYSPTMASKRWATLDSYIADFQKGFFENNAIPAGMFVITAASEKDFEDTKITMQEKHRGAGNNNNVSYVPRPMAQDGKPADSKVEWVPFAQSNKDIDFKPLLEHVNNRLSESYGVSSIVKGVDSNAKYSNAEVSENGFAKRAVDPLALRNYTQITHELNRITGGLGVAITYKYEIPAISDQQKVLADTKLIESDIIMKMTAEGVDYSLDSVIDAFKLSHTYKLLKKNKASTEIDNDKPDVDEGGEVNGAPDPKEIDGVTPLNKGGAKRADPKAEASDQDKLEKVALDLMQAQVDKAVAAIDTVQDMAEDEDLDKFVDDALDILTKLVVAAGTIQTEEGRELIVASGLAADTVTDFSLRDDQLDRYRQYLRMVGQSYSEETFGNIRAILEKAHLENLPAEEIRKALSEIPSLEGYRATRIARTETVRAGGNGSLYSMEQIKDQTGYDIYKVWQVNSDEPCPYCESMNGTKKPVDQPYVPLGGSITADDGSILVNNFVDMDTAQSHPNCRCSSFYEVVS